MNVEQKDSSMTTFCAVGESRAVDAVRAGREAAAQALEGIQGRNADLVLVFATTGYDQAVLVRSVKEAVGAAALVGCSGEGVITQKGSREDSHCVAVMALASSQLSFQTYHVEGLSKDAKGCGEALAAQILDEDPLDAKALLVFPDGLTGNCTEFLAGLRSKLSLRIPILGGTAGDMLKMERTYQYHGDRVYGDSVSAVLLKGPVFIDFAVNHGCSPIGLPRRVTKKEGAWIHEIDGRKAWDVFKEYLEGDLENIRTADIVHLCVGEPLSEETISQYDRHVIRTPLRFDKDKGSLFFPGGLQAGDAIQFTRRNPEHVAASAKACAHRIASRHPNQAPLFVLQFDCAGRGRTLFGEKTNQTVIKPAQIILGRTVPWIGFHTFGEIAPIGKNIYFHNYTVVLCVAYPAGDRSEPSK